MSEKKKKLGIVFVCTGNTCRSPMAEFMFKAYLKEKGVAALYNVFSAGLYAQRGDVMSESADAALTILGVKHTPKKARTFTVQMALDADVVIGMTDEHAAACGDESNIYSFTDFGLHTPISDPYGRSLQDYLTCAAQIRSCFDDIFALCEGVRKKESR